MWLRHRVCLYIGLFAMFYSNRVNADFFAQKVLHRTALSESRELVVTKDPMVPVAAIQDLLSAELVNRPVNNPSGFLSVNVELHFVSGDTLRLWSKMYPIYRESQYEEFQILDLMLLPNRVVIVLAGTGSSINVIEIGLHGLNHVVGLRSADWSLLGAAIPASPGRLNAKLTFNEEKGVEVEITDFLQDTKQHTLFQQKGDQWEFVPVKQRQEKVAGQ